MSGCSRWHRVFTEETKPLEQLTGPGLFLWARCGKGLVFVGTWGTDSRHPIREPGDASRTTAAAEVSTMALRHRIFNVSRRE
jgi:hypothetical protein